MYVAWFGLPKKASGKLAYFSDQAKALFDVSDCNSILRFRELFAYDSDNQVQHHYRKYNTLEYKEYSFISMGVVFVRDAKHELPRIHKIYLPLLFTV